MKFNVLAIRPHVGLMPSAKNKMEQDLVLVCQNILGTLIRVVALNAPLITTVLAIRHALIVNAEIHVRAYAARMPNVT